MGRRCIARRCRRCVARCSSTWRRATMPVVRSGMRRGTVAGQVGGHAATSSEHRRPSSKGASRVVRRVAGGRGEAAVQYVLRTATLGDLPRVSPFESLRRMLCQVGEPQRVGRCELSRLSQGLASAAHRRVSERAHRVFDDGWMDAHPPPPPPVVGGGRRKSQPTTRRGHRSLETREHPI